MADFTPSSPAPAEPPPSRGFALAGRLLVVVVFMTQFLILILGLGGLLPYLHQQGVNGALLALGTLVAFFALHALLGFALRRIPVRCRACGGRSYFTGFGWWPFIYRFCCGACGMERRMEIGGR